MGCIKSYFIALQRKVSLLESKISVFDCNIKVFSFISLSFHNFDVVSDQIMISMDFKLKFSMQRTVIYKNFDFSIDVAMMSTHFVDAYNLGQLNSKLIENYSQFRFYFFVLMILKSLSF